MRTITGSGKGSEESQDLQFNGIANARKLKSFVMSDILTLYIYKRFSIQHFYSDSTDEEQSLQDIRRISKQFVYQFIGTNSGTPANQISKRVDDLLFRVIKGVGKGSTQVGATKIAEGNREYYENTLNPASEGPFISTRLKIQDEGLVKSIVKDGPGSEDGTHTDLGRVCRWIVDLLISARSDELLQCVMKKQYDIMLDVFGRSSDIPEDVMMDVTRYYMALNCLLSSEMDRIGDEYEVVLDSVSFNSLVPGFERPPLTDNLLAIRHEKTSDEGVKQCSALFRNVRFCNGFIHDVDLELAIYKARVSMEFGRFNLMIVEEGHSDWISTLVMRILDKIGWMPEHTLRLMDSQSVDMGSIAVIYDSGVGLDNSSISTLSSVYRDLLKTGYEGVDDLYEGFEETGDCIGMVRKMRAFVEMNRMVHEGDRSVFAHAVKGWLVSLDKVL